MIEFLFLLYDSLGLKKLIPSDTINKFKSITNIDEIDIILNKLIIGFYYFKKNLDFDKFCELSIYAIEYLSTIFMIISLIYLISYMKESVKNLLKTPSIATDSKFQKIFDELNNKNLNKINETSNSGDNVLFIKNKSTGEFEKFKLIRLLKDLSNLNANNNNNRNNESSNMFELVDYNDDDKQNEQSILTFKSILTEQSQKSIIETNSRSVDTSKTLTLMSQNNNDFIKIDSLSMLSQIVITKAVSSNSVVPLNKTLNTNTSIVSAFSQEINERLNKLNLKRLYPNKPIKCCIFACIAYSLMHIKNEEFWIRFEKKSGTLRPNLHKSESRQQFILKLRSIVFKFWVKNLKMFFEYTLETDKQNNINPQFKTIEELKVEMKNYLNDGYHNLDSLDYTIPCILSTCLQINIFLIRSDTVIKITPDMLGKIYLNNLSDIYLIQQSSGTYEPAIKKE